MTELEQQDLIYDWNEELADGSVMSWGWNHYGQLGTGVEPDAPTPIGTGPGQAPEERCDAVSDALPDDLFVRGVLGLGQVVGHDRCEQGIDDPQKCQGEGSH